MIAPAPLQSGNIKQAESRLTVFKKGFKKQAAAPVGETGGAPVRREKKVTQPFLQGAS
jgi:hypothetical protein